MGKQIAQISGTEKPLRASRTATDQANQTRQETQMRNEATYRAQAARYNAAINDYYAKQGWAVPDTSTQPPGAFTTSPLPGDAPLYPDYKTPNSVYDYKQKEQVPPENMPKMPNSSNNPGANSVATTQADNTIYNNLASNDQADSGSAARIAQDPNMQEAFRRIYGY